MTEQGLALAVEALRRSAVQLRGVWPRLGFDDLRPLAAIIGDARVVGLGEAAHGAGELFTVKHRLIEYLVVELGFTGVAFEASYAGCQPIDEYVRHGRGVAAEALTGQGYTAWDTDEVSALVEWLRLHNGGVPHDRKVAFYGLDSGYNAVGRRAVLDLVARAAPNHLSAAHEIFSSLETLEPKWPFCFDELDELAFQQAYQGLQELERALADKATSAAQTRRFVRIMAQWAGPDRDDRSRHMGQNLLEIIAGERSDAKFIIWQHNRHIGRGTTRFGQQSLGDVLSGRFGDDYRAIAMEFGDTPDASIPMGARRAWRCSGSRHPPLVPFPGSCHPQDFGHSLSICDNSTTIQFSVNGCPRHRRNMPSAGPTTRPASTTKAPEARNTTRSSLSNMSRRPTRHRTLFKPSRAENGTRKRRERATPGRHLVIAHSAPLATDGPQAGRVTEHV